MMNSCLCNLNNRTNVFKHSNGGKSSPNTYFYVTGNGENSSWYDNYRNKAMLRRYDDTEKGIDYR